jgi:hypothetical protein
MNEINTGVILCEGACYRVSFYLVVCSNLADRYVLGYATNDQDMVRTEHAWVRMTEGSYADPLLQHLGFLDSTRHDIRYELTRDQVLCQMRLHYGQDYLGIMMGEIDFCPPAINEMGEIVFE